MHPCKYDISYTAWGILQNLQLADKGELVRFWDQKLTVINGPNPLLETILSPNIKR